MPAAQPELARHFAERWTKAPGLDSFFIDLHFLARSYDDDRTVVGAWMPHDRAVSQP